MIIATSNTFGVIVLQAPRVSNRWTTNCSVQDPTKSKVSDQGSRTQVIAARCMCMMYMVLLLGYAEGGELSKSRVGKVGIFIFTFLLSTRIPI